MTDAVQDNEDIDAIDHPAAAGETAEISSLEEAEQSTDHEALAKFADAALADGDQDDVGEDDVVQADSGYLPEEKPAESTDDQGAGQDENADKDDKAAEFKDGDKDADKAADKADNQGGEATPADVLARDGKHTIPYSVLEDTRKRLQAEEARRQELEAELEKAKAGDAGAGDKPTDAGVKLTEEEQAHVDRLREEYGDELAAPVEAAYLRSARLEQRIESIQQSGHDGGDTKDENAEIQSAIDASPIMAAWQARGDDWYSMSADVYQKAMQTDPEFAAKSVHDRFQELPQRVMAAYGRDPNLPADKTDAKDEKPADKAAEKDGGKDEKPDETPAAKPGAAPFSVSDIPGGASPEGDKYGGVEKMSSASLQEYINSRAETGNLDQLIADIA